MDYNEFCQKMFEAYQQADGDIWTFWRLLNPDKKQVERTNKEVTVFLYCNRRKNKTTGEEFIKRVAKVGDAHYEFNFHTATVPKFNGFIAIEDYIKDDEKKTIIVYKFKFLSAKTEKNADDLGF